LTAIDELKRERGEIEARQKAELEQLDETIATMMRFANGVAAPAQATKRAGRKLPTLKCRQCDRTFKGQAWLDKHVTKVHES
jgi:hypothetical protein